MGKVGKAIGIGIIAGAIIIATGGLGTGVLSGLATHIGGAAALHLGVGLTAAVAGGIAGGLIAGGLLLANSVLTPGLPDIQEQSGQKVPITNPLDTRKIIYGDGTLIAGTEIFIEEYDSNGADDVPNDTVVFARIVSDRPVSAFGDFYLGDKVVNFDGGGSAIGTYAGKLFLKTYDGTQIAADPWLMAAHVDWNATAIGTGQAYYVVKAIFDPEIFPYGLGEIRGCAIEVTQGAPVYDPRLDSTNGGVGLHRLADTSTWEFSANPVLTIYDFMRDGVLGNPVPDDEIDLDALITAANICDEDVAVNGGGTIKRYSLGGVVDCRKSKLANIDLMLSAMGGRRTWLGGKIQLFAAGPVVQTISLSENDVVALNYIDLIATDQRINEVRASYIDASNRYNQAEAPAYIDAVAQASEGVKTLPLNLPFTQDHRIAQRLAKLVGLEARLPMINVTTMPIAAALAPMHVAGITCPDVELVDEAYRVTKHAIDTSSDSPLGVNMEMVREDATVYAWNAASDEKTPETSGQLGQATGLATVVPAGVIVTPVTVTNADGIAATTLEITWNTPNIAVVSTLVDYRINGSGAAYTPGGSAIYGETKVILLLPAATAYDIQVRHVMGNGLRGDPVYSLDVSTDEIAVGEPNNLAAAILNQKPDGTSVGTYLRFNGVVSGVPDITAPACFKKPDGTWFKLAGGDTHNGTSGCYCSSNVVGPGWLVLLTDGNKFPGTGINNTYMASARRIDGVLKYFKAQVGWRTFAEEGLSESAIVGVGKFDRDSTQFTSVEFFEIDLAAIPDQGVIDGRIETGLNVDGTIARDLPDTIRLDDAGVVRSIANGVETGFARDGDAITFSRAYGTPPSITFATGGLTSSSSLTGEQATDFRANNISATGFIPRLKVKENAGTPTLQTESVSSTVGTQDIEINKAAAGEAYDDVYTFDFDVTVTNEYVGEFGVDYIPGSVSVGIYTNDGGGWTLRKTVVVYGNLNEASSNIDGVSSSVSVEGLTNHAGKEFGVSLEASQIGGSLDVFNNVKYSTAGTPAEASATPAGVAGVLYFAIGGSET